VHLLAPDWAGHHAHGAGLGRAPRTNRDASQATAARWKQLGVPGEQTVLGQWLGVSLRGIKHHLGHAITNASSRMAAAHRMRVTRMSDGCCMTVLKG
jgi:hypothetical protein